MKPRNDVIQIKGSLGGEVTRMELDQGALAHLMSVLTNLYSDTELAVIREYSTNALDSHIFAGQDRPIEVHTPNAMTNEFVVKDYGLGLSKDEIQNVYGSYGASTKRDSDDVAGCLGLGSKSALAHTSAFTVVGVKDGQQTTALIALGEDGVGRIEIVDETETDEVNGVTVRVPASYRGEFDQAVHNFFAYWDKGKVLINGEAPKHFTEGMTQIDDSVWFGESRNWYSEIVVVMGGVSYTVNDRHYTSHLRNRSVVVMADMGDVDFVPSREALNMTSNTRDYLMELVTYVERQAERIIQQKMDASESRAEVIELSKHLLSKDQMDTITWHGVDHQLYPFADNYTYEINNRKSKQEERFHCGSVYDGSRTAILVGKPYSHLSGLQRDKLAKYINDNDLNVAQVVYFRGEIPYMAREGTIIKFEDVLKVVVTERTRSTYKRPDGQTIPWEHWFYDKALDRVVRKNDVVDPKKKIFYVHGAHTWTGRATNILKHYKDTNVVFVKIEGNRMPTFKRAYPEAMTEYEYINTLVKKLDGMVPESDWKYSKENKQIIKMLTGATNDPKIDKIHKILQNSKVEEYLSILSILGRNDTVDHKIPKRTYLQKNYPLVNGAYRNESIEYVNAMYASRNGKDN